MKRLGPVTVTSNATSRSRTASRWGSDTTLNGPLIKSVCAPLTVVADTSTPERSNGLAKPDPDKVPLKLKKTLSPSGMLPPLLMRSLSGTANALSGRTRMLRRMGTRPYRGCLMSISTLVLLGLRLPDAGSAGASYNEDGASEGHRARHRSCKDGAHR